MKTDDRIDVVALRDATSDLSAAAFFGKLYDLVPAPDPPHAGRTHTTTRNEPEPRGCATCGGPIPTGWNGRPRTYCTPDCRVEMARRRRELADLEARLGEVRSLAATRLGQWGSNARREAAALERDVEAARARIP